MKKIIISFLILASQIIATTTDPIGLTVLNINTGANFLSYSYVLHKFVQLLELDDFLPCFMLLKSREKLQQQDQIWKKICEYLKWQYIPSL